MASETPPIHVRAADPSEHDDLTHIARAAKAHWAYPDAWLETWRKQLTLTEDHLATSAVWVATIEDRTAGFCAITRSRGTWSLEHAWVAPGFMGRGVGTVMVRHALNHAWDEHRAPVHVESDPQAVGFYQRLGGRPCGSIPAPMPGAPDRVLPIFIFDPPALPD